MPATDAFRDAVPSDHACRGLRSRPAVAARAQPGAAQPDARARTKRPGRCSTRRAAMRSPSASTQPVTHRCARQRRLLLRRHERRRRPSSCTARPDPGVAENMMSGTSSSKATPASMPAPPARGGLLVIEGNASSRCGISMKGIDIVVQGNIGHMSAFMAQSGNLVVLGDAGDALGDSHLRGAALRARQGRRASAPTASRRRCGPSIWRCCRACSTRPASPASSRRSSGATARRASSTISISTTPTPIEAA